MTALIVIGVILGVALLGYCGLKIYKWKKNAKPKEKKVKKVKEKKIKTKVQESEKIDLKGSYVDVVDKFLYRKELKLLILISRVLPKGYIAFPKIGLETILVPVGNKALYNSIIGKFVDIVIFEEDTMKPKVAIDIFDGSIGDEQLDIESPITLEALKSAELPIIPIRVKSDYTIEELKAPIYKALGIEEPSEENKQ